MLSSLYRIAVSFGIVLVLLILWFAIVPKTVEEDIEGINRRIAPDGYLTKTHLYVHWQADYTKPRRNDLGGKEIVPAVTLKIPLEYLANNLHQFQKVKFNAVLKKEPSKIDYYEILNVALAMDEHQITRIFLRLLPDDRPDMTKQPNELVKNKSNRILSSFALSIHRNDYHTIPMKERGTNSTSKDFPYEKAPQFSCSGEDFCSVNFSLKGRDVDILGIGKSLENLNKINKAEKTFTPITPYPDTNNNQVLNDLPKWHEKVDPAQALLNSFILSEDNLETKGMFPSPEQKGVSLGVILFEKTLSTEQIPKFWRKSSEQQ
jgi:hypothetical protein